MDQLEQLRKSFEILQASAPDPESIADEIASADEELQAKEKELQALKEELDEKVRAGKGLGCGCVGLRGRGRGVVEGCGRWSSSNEQLDAGVEGGQAAQAIKGASNRRGGGGGQ